MITVRGNSETGELDIFSSLTGACLFASNIKVTGEEFTALSHQIIEAIRDAEKEALKSAKEDFKVYAEQFLRNI